MHSVRKFVVDGVLQDCRNDGRTALLTREYSFQTSVNRLAVGSCSVRVGLGSPVVVVGVKADVCEPKEELGFCEVSIEFAQRTANTHEISDRLGKQLTELMLRHLDCKQLTILPGYKCWGLYIDLVVILPDASNLLELMSQGIYRALQATRIQDIEAIVNKRTQEVFLDVKPSYFELDLESLPLISSVYLIGDRLILDASPEEELFAEGVLHISVRNTQILGILKERPGGFNPSQVLQSVKYALAAASLVLPQLAADHVQYNLTL